MRLMQQNKTPQVQAENPCLLLNGDSEQNNNNGPQSPNKAINSGETGASVTCGGDKVPLTVGSFLLARWYDDLFHPAQLVKVKAEDESCVVQFDDGSEVTVPVCHVQWPPLSTDKEICCSLCHLEHSKQPNQIVLCDGCGLGFHQRCHHPLISEDTLKADSDWFCVLCVLKQQQQKFNQNGMLQVVRSNTKICRPKIKRIPPYQLSTLHWTENHCQNQERSYCYCGGSGQWFLKMVQCVRCKQWFHEACLTARPGRPQTCGDTAYLFMCYLCNSGHELLHRIDLRWADIAHIALFNLSLGRGKYADFDTDLMPWINKHWESLNVGKLESVELGQRFMLILRALREDTVKFKNGSEMKKRAAWYALRVRSPPFVPAVSLPVEQKNLTPLVLKDWLAPGTNRILHLPPSSVPVNVPNFFHKNTVTGGKKRKRSLDTDTDPAAQAPQCKKKRVMNSSDEPLPKLNGIHPSSKSLPSTTSASTESPATHTDHQPKLSRKKSRKSYSLLNREIPVLSDYSGLNNPFLYDIEVEAMMAKHKARCQHFNTFTSGLPAVKTANCTSSASVTSNTKLNGQHRNGGLNGLRRREALNGFSSNGAPANSLERCIYEGDALEWDEFQLRAVRCHPDTGTVAMFTEYYDDMPELKMKLY